MTQHICLESQACHRQALSYCQAFRVLSGVLFDQALIDAGYCIDAPDILGETLHSNDDGGCAFQWPYPRG